MASLANIDRNRGAAKSTNTLTLGTEMRPLGASKWTERLPSPDCSASNAAADDYGQPPEVS